MVEVIRRILELDMITSELIRLASGLLAVVLLALFLFRREKSRS